MDNKQRQRNIRKRRKEKGLCIVCGKNKGLDRLDKVSCLYCSKYQTNWNKEKRKRMLLENRCVLCGSKEIINKDSCNPIKKNKDNKFLNCYKCYLKKAASNYLGSAKLWTDLEKLYIQQKGKCYYTGLDIQIGKDASLDHTIPCFGKRKTDITKLKWVNIQINYMKGILSEKKFREMCTLVHKKGI